MFRGGRETPCESTPMKGEGSGPEQKNQLGCDASETKALPDPSKFGKLSSGPRTGKGQFSSQSQRKAMPKNAQTTTQLHSSHTLIK